MKILIADDSRVMRQIVTRTLRQAGFGDAELFEAEHGVDGLAKVAEVGPDLVLSDWNMPEMTGIEFLKALRADGLATQFGFVTSESTAEMKEQAIAAGANFVITKPFTAEGFEEVLSGVVR